MARKQGSGRTLVGVAFWVGRLITLVVRPYAAPKLGAAPFTGITVAASVVFSVLLDQYGLLGFEQHAAGWGQIAGAVPMCIGVLLASLT